MQVLSKIAKYFLIYVVATVDIAKVKGTVNESATSICAIQDVLITFTKLRAPTLYELVYLCTYEIHSYNEDFHLSNKMTANSETNFTNIVNTKVS